MAIHSEVSTLEVAIKSSAGAALGNLDSLIKKLEDLTVVLERAVSKSEGLANIGENNTKGFTNTSKGAKETEKHIESMNTQMDKFVDKMNKTDFTGVEKSAKSAYKVVKDYADEMKRFGVDTEQKGMKILYAPDPNADKKFRSIQNGISRKTMLEREKSGEWKGAFDTFGGGKGSGSSAVTKALDALVDSAVRAQTALGAAKLKAAELFNYLKTSESVEGSSGLDRFASRIVNAFRFVKTFASYLGGTLKGAFNVLKTAITTVSNALHKLGAAFKSALGHVKSFAHGLAHPIATLKSMFGMGGGSGGGLLGGLLRGRSLGQFVGLIVLRRAVMAALRAIVNGIKEGFENIRNYSSAINSEINSMQNSLLYVKNAWAAAFAPIVSVVRPYINYLLDAIAAALNAIGRLMALLTGKGFAVQAVKLSDAMYEAGKAGNAAAGGTSKAAKAAEDYKKTIMSFDQLHVLNAQGSGSGGSGGGGGGGGGAGGGLNVNDMFTTVSLAGAFKDAIDAEDWEELGRLMAEKVNSAFLKLDELISWENVGDKITKKIKALTTTLNSFIDNLDWEQIGRTFGSGINTLVNTWNLFFDNFDFVNLGTKIAEGVNGLFDRVDWNELGRAVTQKFKALWETISGFVKTLDWGSIGTSIGEFLNGALKNISLPDIGATIGRAVSGLAIAIKDFTLTFDWDEAFEQVKDFFVNLLEEINTSDLIGAVGDVCAKIVEGLTYVVTNSETQEQLKKFAKNIGQALGSLKWVEYLGTLAIAIVQALEELLSGLLEGFVEGLLIKMGVSPDQAHSAFEHRDEFETAYQTGDTSYLPGGDQDPTNNSFFTFWTKVHEVMGQYNEWLKQHPEFTGSLTNNLSETGMGALGKLLELLFPSGNEHTGSGGTFEVPVTGVLVGARDEIPTGAKVTTGWMGKLGSMTDADVPASGKISTGWFGKLGSMTDTDIPTGAKISTGWFGKLGSATDKDLPQSDKVTGGWTAQFRYMNKDWWSYANKDWTVGGWTAQFKYKNTNWWSYANKDWTTGGWTAQYKYKSTKWWSTKNSDWTTGGWTAKFNYTDKSGLSRSDKTIEVTATITKLNMIGGLVGNAVGNANGGVFSGGTWKPITRYASGGNPQSAEIFMAREAGPELVGRIGSKTAVMNNNQIVSSVAAGVKAAVAEAIMATRSTADSGMPYQINVTVKTQDDEVLARCVERGMARKSYRFGTA